MNKTSPRFTEVALPQATLIDAAAEEIVRRFADRLPNLSSLTVLLPNLHAASGVKQALRRAAGNGVLLLPRFATLRGLTQTVAVEQPIASPSLRLVQIYSALKARGWFDAADLWSISGELAQLLGELTRAQTELPDNVPDFVGMLERAYRAKPDVAMHFEARLAHEMWYALGHADALDRTLDEATAYQMQLRALASSAWGPLCTIGLAELAPAETAFLHKYAERQPVVTLIAAASADSDPLTLCLTAAWVNGAEPLHASIKQRAEEFAQQHASPPLRGRLAVHAAVSLEDEARAATQEIKSRLAEGKRNIALVAADRLTARRVRALLERAAILLADESGWTLSTTSASTIIMRLLDALSGGFYYRDVLDLAKSPFFAADWPPARRKRAVHRLEGWLRENNVIAGLERLRAMVARQAAGGDESEIVSRLARAQARFKASRQALSRWIQRLLDALDDLGATPGLQIDAAGRQLLDLLALRRQELASHNEPVSLLEWRRWLTAELETVTFRDAEIDSPVVLTTLAATRLRRFEAVVLVGADALHLAARPPTTRLFNQSVRCELGLPTSAEKAAQMEGDLISLIAGSDTVLMTWQASRRGEHNAASPWLSRLQAFYVMAYGEPLPSPPAQTVLLDAGINFHDGAPVPTVPSALLPEAISASAYGSLMACPYQFFARHVLQLNPRDEVAEEMEKRDYGELLHDILARFHRQHGSVSALSAEEAETALRRMTDEVFSDSLKNNYAGLAWKLRWEKRIPAYLAWQRRREEAGWRFHAAEEKLQRPLTLQHGQSVRLHGRLDRIDRRTNDGRFAVLDYKAQEKKRLTDKLKQPGEDVQLAVYALLLGEEVVEAAYVSLDGEPGVGSVAIGETLPLLVKEVGARLTDVLNDIARGESLPAQGATAVCRPCEMRGLCRLDYWDIGEHEPQRS